jgi:enediyne biosynthesis protein E4
MRSVSERGLKDCKDSRDKKAVVSLQSLQSLVSLAFLLCALLNLSPAQAASPDFFVDRAAEWGLAFTYASGRTGELYFPEIMGGGAALFDYDGDGDLDVFVVQGHSLKPGAKVGPEGWGRLFRNDLITPKGKNPVPRFVDVTEASGIRAVGYGMGVATGDYDNDGRIDLYLANFGSNQLWHNEGDGKFTDVTARTGTDDPRWSAGAAFVDLDRDGWLDLFVLNYVDFSVQNNVRCYAPSSRRDYCGPQAFPPVTSRLLRNRGNGTFEDVSLKSGIGRKAGPGLGVVAADLDGNGWPDLFVANDGSPSFLWLNQKDLTFKEDGLLAGVAVNAAGKPEAGMGIALGDCDGDGDDDLLITHLTGETNTLYLNQGGGLFEDATARSGLGAPSLPYTGFGTAWLDFDDDGWLDLAAFNGAVNLNGAQWAKGDLFPYAQPDQLFRNQGSGHFVEVGPEAGAAFRTPRVSRGAAFGDVDNDGDTDILVVDTDSPVRLLINETGSRKPWLGLRLAGKPAGGRVEVRRKGAPSLWRRAATDGSYASASDPRVLVGLGEATEVTEVRVVWPDGVVEIFPPPPLRTYTTLVRGTGKAPEIKK